MPQTIVINMKLTHHWDIRAEYEYYVRTNEGLLAALPELIGKRLACWCVPRPCHGHILLKIMKERGLIDAEGYALQN